MQVATANMASKKHHNNSLIENFIGPSAELPQADLPTLRDVLCQCLLLRERQIASNADYDLLTMASDVLPLILNIWRRANAKFVEVPIRVGTDRLTQKIKTKWETMVKIASRKGKLSARQKQAFVEDLDKLFNILTCVFPFIDCANAKCDDKSCTSVHMNCKCPREAMIPKLDLSFIKDQREKTGTKGKLQMALGDSKETARQVKALKRKEVEAKRAEERELKKVKEEEELKERISVEEERVRQEEEEEELKEGESQNEGEDEMREVHVDPTFQSPSVDRRIRSETHQQNRTPLPSVAEVVCRGGGSRRFAAAIVTATLIDYGIITKDNKSQITTKDKIQREIDRCINSQEMQIDEDKPIKCVFFDGRNDSTKVMLEDERGKKYPSTVREEHITMTSEPGGTYIGHFAPDGKDAPAQTASFNNFLAEHGIDKTIEIIGGDSTNIVMGPWGGVMTLLEKILGRRLVRVVCELHTNELALRHIITELDGPTSGANTFSGV